MARDALTPLPRDAPRDSLSRLIEEVRAVGGVDGLSLRAWLALAERWRTDAADAASG